MRKIKVILSTVLVVITAGAFLVGCSKEESTNTPIERQQVSVRLNAMARTVTETDGQPTADEQKIYSFRVYAYDGGRQIGHYFSGRLDPEVTTVEHRMDIEMAAETKKKIEFIVIANEGAMEVYGNNKFQLSETTSRDVLENLSFTQIKVTEGLPMFCTATGEDAIEVDFSRLADGNPQTGPDKHEGHYLLEQKLSFPLQRPFAKLGVFAAKRPGEQGELTIKKMRILPQGVLLYNYILPQSSQKLEGIPANGSQTPIALTPVSAPVTAEVAEGTPATPSNCTPVLEKPYYPFENPWGSPAWDTPGDDKGNILEIDYAFDGTERTGRVYLPPMVRNKYYQICCTINNSGRITIDYMVAPWTQDDTDKWDDLDFVQPTTEPFIPIEGADYEKPTLVYNPVADNAKTFKGRFKITAPAHIEWKPTLIDGTESDYEIIVSQQGVSLGAGPYPISPEYYTIEIRPLKELPAASVENGHKIGLMITYMAPWSDESEPIRINPTDEHGDTRWPGNEVTIEIVQIAQDKTEE